jgi:pimeloyl-ACP methyl ester carboxylesterase
MTVMAEDFFRPLDGPRLRVADARGAGLPVLFQHGLCGDARQTAEVFPSDVRLRCITLECRGHGGSEAGDAAAFTIPRFADDIAEFITAQRLSPLVVGGISMGAAIAMRLAVMRPDLVRGLVIARPAWSVRAAPANMQPNAEVGALLSRMRPEAARQAFATGGTAQRLAVESPDNLASLMGFFTREPAAVTAALLTAISHDGPGVDAEQLRRIAVPTLVITTRMDMIHPLALAEEIAGLIPQARLAEITPKGVDRQKHVAEFRNALDDFLKGFLS